ncbi:MAG: hypothetical protein AAB724_01485, partial [Patescibacteria group bacterium]
VDQYDGDVFGEQISDEIRRGKITWNKAKIPALALIKPNDEINIDVRLPIKGIKDFDLPSVSGTLVTAASFAAFTNEIGVPQTINANPVSILLILTLNLKIETVFP